ncbi:MAG: hypothetical protein AB1750_00450 [Chloroflexota bacterium]
MTKSSSSFLGSLLSFLSSLFGEKKGAAKPKAPAVPPDSADEPAAVTVAKVLAIVYDPDMGGGQKLSRKMNWYKVEDLGKDFMSDILQCSYGLARYEIVQRIDVNEFPAKVDGFRYAPASYLDVIRGAAQPHEPAAADYAAIFTRFNILPKVARGEIDEVWIFAFPHAGFYESAMGGRDAFWCNAPPLKGAEACPRRFVTMGFNYERGVGEMLESFGHRAESIMLKTFEKLVGNANLWQRFIRYDRTSPGRAACGNVHFAPNSERDYDWNNSRSVPSECDDWLTNFPNFKGGELIREVSSAEWGAGEIRAHHTWWLKHFPHTVGRRNGIHNNWWQYLIDPNKIVA